MRIPRTQPWKASPRKRWALLALFPLATLLVALALGGVSPVGGVEVITYSGSLYTLADYPAPFISTDGTTPTTYIILPSSSPHGPCGSAHTMDTMGSVSIAYRLGVERAARGGLGTLETALDCYSSVSTYDSGTAKATMTDTVDHLICIGGPGINQITYYYNEMKDDGGAPVLPVTCRKDASGDYLHVQSSGNRYRLKTDSQGRVTTDYSVIQLYRDGSRHVLLIYGLGGEGTRAAAELLADFSSWHLTGVAAIVKYQDSNGDGYLDTTTVQEEVAPPSSPVGIYNDAACRSPVSSVNWGDIEAGTAQHVTFYLKNLGNQAVTLNLGTQNWSPSAAQSYIALSWNDNGTPLAPNTVRPVTITLTISPSITGITTFSFEIVVTSLG
jgi:hypothetical protein